MVTTRPPKTIVKPTALGPVANTDTKLLIYSLFQQGRVLAQDGVSARVHSAYSSTTFRFSNTREFRSGYPSISRSASHCSPVQELRCFRNDWSAGPGQRPFCR